MGYCGSSLQTPLTFLPFLYLQVWLTGVTSAALPVGWTGPEA